jgi:serine-type D-Ala-D-Ala carboxypeptidase (penicillin-binding protein 5/6)
VLGSQAPPLSENLLRPLARERVRRTLRIGGLTLAVVGVVALAVFQWFRPVPSPVFPPTIAGSARIPGEPPSLAWPGSGEAAVSLQGTGSPGGVGATRSVPISGLAKVMTAYVILRDHPLAPGEDGPEISVSPAVVSDYQAEASSQQSVIQVSDGETLSELQALEGVLVASANDMADLLATWDAGNASAFVNKMNSAAHVLHLGSGTHFADPSGVDPRSVSTPTALIALGEAAMAIPDFKDIVGMPQISIPLAGTLYNTDSLLGHGPILGIKTGSDAAAGGCFLFEAQETVAGKRFSLFGAVLGQKTATPTASALFDADLLVGSTFSKITEAPAITPGAVVGRIVAPWGGPIPVRAFGSAELVGLPGQHIALRMHLGRLNQVIPDGSTIGTVTVNPGRYAVQVHLRASRALAGPSTFWRLTRL